MAWKQLPIKGIVGTEVADEKLAQGPTWWRRLLGQWHLAWTREVVLGVPEVVASDGWYIGYQPWWNKDAPARFKGLRLTCPLIRLRHLQPRVRYVAIDCKGHEIPLRLVEIVSREVAAAKYGNAPLL